MEKLAPGIKSSLQFVNHDETYGPKIMHKITRLVMPKTCLDIGAGNGRDLTIVYENCRPEKLYAVDFRPQNPHLINIGAEVLVLDIERDPIPVEDESIDLVIANQTMEHLKEIYWANHQIFCKLKVGGFFAMGVPNLLALHNRILPLFGYHPTCIKAISAHVRGFSIRDTRLFYNSIGSNFLRVERVYGSQFYPFPTSFSRALASTFPGLATSIFFLIRKTGTYENEFIAWPQKNTLETNFFIG
jgi:SAM-dependent methyltransferase